MKNYHIPIMVKQVIRFLKPQAGGIFVDGTLGGGGHARALLAKCKKDTPWSRCSDKQKSKCKIIGIDLDEDAIKESKKRLKKYQSQMVFIQDNFSNIKKILAAQKNKKVKGIILDLGVSTHQLETPTRGFSFSVSKNLDMRFNQKQKLTARDILNNYSFEKLKNIFSKLGESPFAAKIANEIIKTRQSRKISKTQDLLEIIKRATPPKWRFSREKHFATNIFRALRMEVNQELENLRIAIPDMINVLKSGGRLAIITFHSLEDRIVKKAFRQMENPCTCPPKIPFCVCGKKPIIRVLTKKPILPGQSEISQNPKARSAKLRVAEKL